MKNYIVSEYIHCSIRRQLGDCKTIIDMGGKGRLKGKGLEITNANIKYGIDATKLPFDNNSFDAAVSIVTLEHVGDEEKQIQFVNESIRVGKKRILHWIPIHEEVELFLKDLNHNHPCVIPKKKVLLHLKEQGFKKIDSITVREHLINLAMIYPKLAREQLYDFAQLQKNSDYLILLEKINKE